MCAVVVSSVLFVEKQGGGGICHKKQVGKGGWGQKRKIFFLEGKGKGKFCVHLF